MAAGGAEALPFGILVFVTGALLAANAWAVVDARVAVVTAAHEAARAYVEAPDATSAAEHAREAAGSAVASHGRDPGRLDLRLELEGGRAWGRCARVVATASYSVPAADVPWVGGWGSGVEVSASRSELVDPHRAGLPGAASCT